MSTHFDEYQFLFSQVLNNPKTRACLLKYMTKEYNEQPLQFWEAVQALSQSEQDKVAGRVQEIVETFFSSNSRMEINVSAGVKSKVKSAVDLFMGNQATCTDDDAARVFDAAMQSVLESMERDTFVRFVRSEIWKKFVKKNYKSEEDLEKIAIHKSQLKRIRFQVEDEERSLLSERDVEIGVNLMRDGIDWKLLRTNRNLGKYSKSIMFFKSRVQFVSDECEKKYGKLKTYKVVISMDIPAKEYLPLTACRERYDYIWGPAASYNSFLEFPAKEVKDDEDVTLNTIMFDYDVDLKVPFANIRTLYFCNTCIYLPSIKAHIDVLKTVPKHQFYAGREIPKYKKKKVAMRNSGFHIVQEISEDSCIGTHIICVDTGGNLNKDNPLSRLFSEKALITMFTGVAKRISESYDWWVEAGKPQLDDFHRKQSLFSANSDLGAEVDKRLTKNGAMASL